MIELLRTNDSVLISWLQALLVDSGIGTVLLDTHASVVEGSANAIQRRLMVSDEDADPARRIMEAARIAHGAP